MDRLQHYDYEVKYIKGQDNVVADFLSRVGEESAASTEPTLNDDDDSVTIAAIFGTDSEISHEMLLHESKIDKNLALVKKYLRSNWPSRKKLPNVQIKKFFDCANEISEKDGLLFRGNRLIIPEKVCTWILSRLHDGHPGIVRMKQLYRELYYWPRGSTEVEEFVNSCHACAESGKSNYQEKVPTGAIEPPEAPWQRICIDITGPFWTAPKHEEYIVIVMDYFSKWPEYLLTGNTTSSKIISWLSNVFANLGNPLEIVSDNGPQFISDEFEEFLASKAIKHRLTPVYCPERNGLVERFNHVIKHGSQAYNAIPDIRFRDAIRKIISNFRATAPQNSKSPAELLRGWKMRTDADIRNALLVAEGAVTDAPPRLNLDERRSIVQRKFGLRKFGKVKNRPKSPYRIGDVIQFILPKSRVRKGQSPKSRPMVIKALIGKWDYRLSDGQVWNARRLIRYRPAYRPSPEIDLEDLDYFVPEIENQRQKQHSMKLRSNPKQRVLFSPKH
ncbi:MAG: DDE-type integrase/transposase/recombinase [Desulfobacterales bacterium]|nr:DDE-type integrase/transposase/recombinase [Desulfobacterales bacterium]